MDHPSKPPPETTRGKPDRRRKKTPGSRPAADRIRIVERALSDAIRATYVELFGERTGTARPFTLSVEWQVEPQDFWRLNTRPPLEQRIRAAVQEMEIRAEAYQEGRVYCYRCESSRCPHSVPPRPGCVFGGYASTGRPLWPDLLQVLLEQKCPNIDRLYASTGHDLAVACMPPESLKHRQLAIFGKESKTYDILGQLVFGFLDMSGTDSGHGEKERVAFTVQAVESRNRDGSPRIELNVLGRLHNGEPAMDAVRGPFQSRVFHTIASARRSLRTLAAPGRRPGAPQGPPAAWKPAAHSMDHLRRLARTLERLGAQRGRRTAHAEERRSVRRHSSNAWQDAANAPDELFLWDEHRRTVVVVGPKNRVHVFSADARHVTSLLLQSGELESRQRRKRWTPLAGDALERFRTAVALSGRGPNA